MYTPPNHPKIYHITHIDNLPSIIKEGGLVSDAVIIARSNPSTTIGMTSIKQRRLNLPVRCHPGCSVGDFVPFYFCPRSIMLYIIHMANNPELTYHGGQAPIIHLEADLNATVEWANRTGRRWAFSLANAGANYSEFRKEVGHLSDVNWPAVAASDFRPREIKEGKQAEFLLHGSFPWELVSRIGVHSLTIARRAHAALDTGGRHRPAIEILPNWYF